jgi:hypothetical protein
LQGKKCSKNRVFSHFSHQKGQSPTNSQEPLHDFRQRTVFIRTNDEVDVVPHDAEVVNSEGVLLFQPFKVRHKQDTHGGFQENELAAVDSGGDVVDGVLFQVSILPHTSIYGFKVRVASIFEKKV